MKVTRETVKDVVLNEVPPAMRNRYTLRVKDSSFGPNSKGNSMITLNCEIVSPNTITLDGKTYALDSLEVPYYFPLQTFNTDGSLDEEKTNRNRQDFLDLLKKLGLPEDFDDENPDLSVFDGICFDAIVDSKERIPQRKEGNRYVPITDENGKPLSQGWQVQAWSKEILKRSYAETNRAY